MVQVAYRVQVTPVDGITINQSSTDDADTRFLRYRRTPFWFHFLQSPNEHLSANGDMTRVHFNEFPIRNSHEGAMYRGVGLHLVFSIFSLPICPTSFVWIHHGIHHENSLRLLQFSFFSLMARCCCLDVTCISNFLHWIEQMAFFYADNTLILATYMILSSCWIFVRCFFVFTFVGIICLL